MDEEKKNPECVAYSIFVVVVVELFLEQLTALGKSACRSPGRARW